MKEIAATRGTTPSDPFELECTYYGKKGEPVHNENLAVCKAVKSNQAKRTMYFIKVCGSQLYDVQANSTQYDNKLWKFQRVNSEKFHTYLRYLQTGRKVHLSRAERIYG